MVRRSGVLWVVLAMSLSAGVGCSQDGAVDVSWDFQPPAPAPNEPASSGCSQHGVDSIVISGIDTGGDGVRVATLCTPGARRIEVAPGTWTIQVSKFDFQGQPVTPDIADPTATVVVTTDAPAVVNVNLATPPPCSDGVDNDGDGRVDAADPDCVNGTE